MFAKTVVSPKPTKCSLGTNLREAAELLRLTAAPVPVLDGSGKVAGLLTVKGLARAILDGISVDSPINSYLEDAIIINGDTRVADLIGYPLERIVIVDDEGHLNGIISLEKMIENLLIQRDNVSGNLNAILAASNNCIISVDRTGLITYLNTKAGILLNVNIKVAVNKPINQFIPDSRLPEVARTGESEIGQKFVFDNKVFITNRTPIILNGRIVGAVAVFQDVTELQNTLEELANVRNYKEILETVIENDYDSIVVVDQDGIITMFNKAYEQFIGVPKEKAIGYHVTDVIENTRMHIVAKTGIAEMGELQKICGHEMICNRIPIKKDGKIWGALGKTMFRDVREFTAFAEKINKLQVELEYYKDMVNKIQGTQYSFEQIIGSSPELMEIKAMAMRVAQSSSTILIRGESGTGKELFAHSIHYASPRKNGPFIKVNCSAIPENLLESELFGYEEGAFTGAKKGGKLGKFELANKGTILLDEIGDMAVNMQIKLLRVLQEKEIERVGGTTTIPIDVRVLAATNRSLEELISEGKFRLDLYYRLNVVELRIPSLRQHKSDLEELIYFLLGKIATKMGCPVPTFDQEALHLILNYDWPGNVRELENVLERCLNFLDNNIIRATNLPIHIRNYKQGKELNVLELKDHLEETERVAIINALKACTGNRVKAARMLGISRASIYQKIDKYGIN